jgi:hypothetical protein
MSNRLLPLSLAALVGAVSHLTQTVFLTLRLYLSLRLWQITPQCDRGHIAILTSLADLHSFAFICTKPIGLPLATVCSQPLNASGLIKNTGSVCRILYLVTEQQTVFCNTDKLHLSSGKIDNHMPLLVLILKRHGFTDCSSLSATPRPS